MADKYAALVMVDTTPVGILGPQGRGTPKLLGVAIASTQYRGTLGKRWR